MYFTKGIEAVATITELRSKTSELVEHAKGIDRGILIQKNNEPYAVLINGDSLDGVHHNSTTQISHNLGDQAFIAEVPELPGCMADGETYRKALANVEVIIQEWIETAKDLGRPIPEPKGRLLFA